MTDQKRPDDEAVDLAPILTPIPFPPAPPGGGQPFPPIVAPPPQTTPPGSIDPLRYDSGDSRVFRAEADD